MTDSGCLQMVCIVLRASTNTPTHRYNHNMTDYIELTNKQENGRLTSIISYYSGKYGIETSKQTINKGVHI